MLRFFRQIRQRLLSENRFSKYLLYAVGEILLVVIGIVIALQLNSWDEKKETEKAVEEILNNMLSELNTDIELYNDILLNFYHQKDSATYLILNIELTEKDYAEFLPLSYVETFFRQAIPMTNSYNQFTAFYQKMPERFKPLIADISNLYEQHHVGVKRYNQKMNSVVWANIETREKYSWYAKGHESPELNEYLLNNPERINKVRSWATWQWNHIIFIRDALQASRALFQKIALKLNRPDLAHNLNVNKEIIELWIGNYVAYNTSKDSFEIIENKGNLLVINSQDTLRTPILPVSKSRGLHLANPIGFLSLTKENRSIVIKNNEATWRKVTD